MTIKNILLLFLFIATPMSMAEEWVYSGSNLEAPSVKITGEGKNLLKFSSEIQDDTLAIFLYNGGLKFGDLNILVKNGENTIMRSRLHITVPMSEAKKVSASKPLFLASFKHLGIEYDVSLVYNSKSKVPDTLVKKK